MMKLVTIPRSAIKSWVVSDGKVTIPRSAVQTGKVSGGMVTLRLREMPVLVASESESPPESQPDELPPLAVEPSTAL